MKNYKQHLTNEIEKLKEELDDIYVEIHNSFDNSKIPTWNTFIEYLKEEKTSD